jgi:hypothetical protein
VVLDDLGLSERRTIGNRLISKVIETRDRETLASLFAIDVRSLVAVRIGLATILLYDSIASLSSPGGGALSLFASIAVLPFACALLVGFKTRWMTAICWLIYGLPIRQGLLEPGVSVFLGRYVLALFLFWSMFLPLARHLSVDARTSSRRPSLILSIGSAAALVQLFWIYFSAGINKHFGEWIFEASAMQDVLRTGFANELGHRAAEADGLMAIVSIATIALEVIGSILLFVPGKRLPERRLLLVGAFIVFHIGMATFMNLGIFPFVMITVWLLFLPSKVWDRLTPDQLEHPVETDRNLLRNLTAGAAMIYVIVSNYITWAFYPADSGFAGQWQEVGVVLLLYQQWAMFSIPSTL